MTAIDVKTIHIAFVLATFSPGGSQSVMVTLANGLAGKGWKVDMVTMAAKGPFLDKLKPTVNVVDLKTRRVSRSVNKLRGYFDEHKPDVIISSQVHTNVIVAVSNRFSKSRAKLILRESSSPYSQYKEGDWLKKLIYWGAFFSYPFADHYVGQSYGLTNELLNFYRIDARKIDTIGNPIISTDLFEQAKESGDHNWLNENIPIILSMGRFSIVKDFPTLIKAFAKVRKQQMCRLIILGDEDQSASDLKDELVKLTKELGIEKDVDFPGFKNNPFPYVRDAKVYVLSSLHEALPGALIQAMALGCKLVSTDCPTGPREVLGNGKFGLLVPVGDVDKMADAIASQLNNNTNAIGDTSKFTEAYIISEYQAMIERVLKV